MIKKVELTNFYGFGHSAIELHPEVNILIGINGSGKSNFLKAFRLLKEGVSGIGLKNYFLGQLGGFDAVYNRTAFPGRLNSNKIELNFTFDTKKFKYQDEYVFANDSLMYKISLTYLQTEPGYYFVEERLWGSDGYEYFHSIDGGAKCFERDSEGVNKDYHYDEKFDSQELVLNSIVLRNKEDSDALNVFKRNIEEIFVYEYFDTSPRSGIRLMGSTNAAKVLSLDGSNLPQMLNIINSNDKKSFYKIEEMFKEVNPNFTGFGLDKINELRLEEREFIRPISILNFSDGTLRYLCLLTIFFNSNRGNIVCIDEPELGLHPDMLFNLASAIKEASSDCLFIISTHSDNLLNYFDVENLKIFEKDEQNGTIIKSFSTEQFAEWYEDYTIGQMWKQGDFGGVRYGN